jgi:26S proteasome regulatory subunit N5
MQAEALLSTMVVSKAVAAKIDRPSNLVIFGGDKEPEELLNGWANNIGKLLGLVEKSVQQISKEAMLHRVALDV